MQDNSERDFYNQGDSGNPFVAMGDNSPQQNMPPRTTVTQSPAETSTTEVQGFNREEEAYSPEIVWSVQEKNGRKMTTAWYVAWGVALLALVALALTIHLVFNRWQFWTTLALGVLIFGSILFLNRQKQHVVDYSLDENQITIDKHSLPLSDFRAFRLNQRNGKTLIELIPIKRFGAEVPVNLPENNKAEQIIEILGGRLAVEQSSNGLIDKMLNKLGL